MSPEPVDPPSLPDTSPTETEPGCSLAVPEPARLPALLTVRPAAADELYGALLADATKDATRRAREQDVRDFGRYLGGPGPAIGPELACAALVSQGRGIANQLVTGYQ